MSGCSQATVVYKFLYFCIVVKRITIRLNRDGLTVRLSHLRISVVYYVYRIPFTTDKLNLHVVIKIFILSP